jgi:hypothetical protein
MNFKILLILSSFVLIFSLRAEEKKSSSCGKLKTAILKVDPSQSKGSLEDFHTSEEEFCDLGKNELLANFDVLLFGKQNKQVYLKSVFLNTRVLNEELKSVDSSQFENRQILQNVQSRIVKFSINKDEEVVSYKIVSKKDKEIIGQGEITYEK